MEGMKSMGRRGGAGWLSMLLIIIVVNIGVRGIVDGEQYIPVFENSREIQELGQFAVEEHNRQQHTQLFFFLVVKAQQRKVVTGLLYYLTIKATDDGTPKLYKAKVWVEPWKNFKELQEFKLLLHPSDGVEQGV